MHLAVRAAAVLCCAAALAQSPERPNPAGPRSGPLYEVYVSVADNDELRRLTAAGYNVESVADGAARVNATAEELLWLGADGYAILRAVEIAPPPIAAPGAKGLGVYHSYDSLTSELESYADTFGNSQIENPDLCRLVSLGTSVQGRHLWALKITDKPDKEEFEPEFKYIATMHGDEPVGTELCLYFIDMLLTEYETDARIRELVDSTELWIVPLMNPDGLEQVSRFNANGYDLNRSFPTWPEDISGTIFDGAPLDDAGRQPEVRRIMQWSANHSFVLSANFHTGALIVNYPYDDDDKGSGEEAPSPDDALFREISARYATPNLPMFTNPSPDFPGGIVNGSLWYEITGGMQDWNYRYLGCNEVTIELSTNKIPNENLLDDLWDDNRESMLAFAESVHIGVRGIVRNRQTRDPLYAKIEVVGNAQPVFTDPDKGDYHRMLLPGTYTLRFSAPGFKTKTVRDVVVAKNNPARVNVKLRPLP